MACFDLKQLASRHTPQNAVTDLFELVLSRIKHVSEFLQQFISFSFHRTSADLLLLLLLLCVDQKVQKEAQRSSCILTRARIPLCVCAFGRKKSKTGLKAPKPEGQI
jgi:hypothetical protein